MDKKKEKETHTRNLLKLACDNRMGMGMNVFLDQKKEKKTENRVESNKHQLHGRNELDECH